MALIKKVKTAIGVEADYWRICKIDIDKIGFSCTMDIRLFYNKEASRSIEGRIEMITDKAKFVQFFSAIALQTSFNDIYNAAYEYVKAYSPFFADAITDDEQFEIDDVFGDEPESPTGDPSGPDLPPGETLDPIGPSGGEADEEIKEPVGNTGETLDPIGPSGGEADEEIKEPVGNTGETGSEAING